MNFAFSDKIITNVSPCHWPVNTLFYTDDDWWLSFVSKEDCMLYCMIIYGFFGGSANPASKGSIWNRWGTGTPLL